MVLWGFAAIAVSISPFAGLAGAVSAIALPRVSKRAIASGAKPQPNAMKPHQPAAITTANGSGVTAADIEIVSTNKIP